MTNNIQPLEGDEALRVEKHRQWVMGHYSDPAAYSTVEGKLRLIQTILDNGWIGKEETWKLQSLGVAFGDALVQSVPELFWAVVDDEFGCDPALRWLQSTTLVFPLTVISKRVEDNVEVDVTDLFDGIQKAARDSAAKSA
jgi:hypothetical protein